MSMNVKNTPGKKYNPASNRDLVKPDCACSIHGNRKKIVTDESGVENYIQDYRFRPLGSR